ncbi:MAG: Lrp/AsnC ligand binding domain-containing protein [Candidatus Freyarchaeota archaeon]|nr:Lrp/AsnC ligand binding domain-containing protein [Candidatus Freyarchaeota archaeon]MDO8090743.1 Lrp/AsnC ligand binding domain-containing protein [Candidatus Sigynarchaeota archaeon]
MIILIAKVEVGREVEVAEKLAKIPEVKSVYLLTGEYDVLAEIDIIDVEPGIDFILENVRKIKGITSTRTIFTKKIK